MDSRTFQAVVLIGVIGAIVVGWLVVLVRHRRSNAAIRENRFPDDRSKRG